MWLVNFRKQDTNIPLTCIFIYTVQTKLVQYIPPPPPNCFGEEEKRKKKTKEKKCVIYFVHVCTPKSLKRQDILFYFIFMSEVTYIPLLIRKYCKTKKQESNWPLNRLYSCISGVFCNTRDTNLWCNIMHN